MRRKNAGCRTDQRGFNWPAFIRGLDPALTTQQFSERLLQEIKEQARRSPITQDFSFNAYIYTKICKGCHDWHEIDHGLLCQVCQDFYHLRCAGLASLPEDDWVCTLCERQKEESKQQVSEGTLRSLRCLGCSKVCCNYKEAFCDQCQSVDQEVRCDFLDNYFVGGCKQQPTTGDSAEAGLSKEESTQTIKLNLRLPPKCGFKSYNSCRLSLAVALRNKGFGFTDRLLYEVNSSMNSARKEPCLMPLSRRDQEVILHAKQESTYGYFGPYEVVEDEQKGYRVVARKRLSRLTFLCEYTGEVLPARGNFFSKNDSIMDLINAPDSGESLVVAPRKWANLARFLNGVNNSAKVDHSNVWSQKVVLGEEVHVILYTSRPVESGEELLYDYNSGGMLNYDTQHFF